jgi:hypothetical protein
MKRPTLILYIVLCFTAGLAVGCALAPVDPNGSTATTQESTTQPAEDGGFTFDIFNPALDGAAAVVPYGAVGLLLVRLFFLERQKRDRKTRDKERTNPTVE